MKTIIATLTFLLISTSNFAGQKILQTNDFDQGVEKISMETNPKGDRNKRRKTRKKNCLKTTKNSKKHRRSCMRPNGSGL